MSGTSTRSAQPAIPCKRDFDEARASWADWPSNAQQMRQPSPPPLPPPPRNLFDCPQEIRDFVYSHCKDETRPHTKAIKREYRGTTIAVIHNAPWLNLTKCKERLAEEYKKSFWTTTTLVLIDFFDANNGLTAPPLHPHLAQNLTRIDTILLAVCEVCERIPGHPLSCQVWDELKNHNAWLKELAAKTPNLKNFTVKLFVQWPQEQPSATHRYPQSPHPFELDKCLVRMLELPALKTLEVHRHRNMSAQEHGLDARRPDAEVFDLYLKVDKIYRGWHFMEEGSEEHRRMERLWWWERQQKGLVTWKDEKVVVPSVVGG
ncbi:hypothetical protein CLAFUW4_08175 [Fulvia fulva]|uniref:uncharacterized protein n=1 Tax=Passalora fulva TaxID=5499 RepID=UPI0004E9CB80|nr:uncharacterized protein CLAFUR5_20253 [Fulvia fulva]KAK4629159.1 hypothetical protein CLAFUR4_08180 [Fulvia fulva]KAK4629795.1 hypothetical protein CLAFUR0_08175 [Fulvia fulva]WMI38828.1 hypothetical protein CLAFUR5_20253 [Fulvia fulva]WPV12677.1 hypothetical protein CLAFUW4_08175 [Fulvia fulva]WPV27419.1 hypothetical protein CLAFUW7_08175 [Fulvia fulva]